MRLLAVDFGFTRIGLAVGETEPQAGSARQPLKAAGSLKKDAEAIAEVAKREEAEAIVLGLPLESDGQEGRMARICRSLCSQIETLGFAVHLVDESLSSVEAQRGLLEGGVKASRRRRLVDGEAALVILDRYLHEQATS